MTIESNQLTFIQNIMRDCPFPWLIAGGWALDLGIGKVTREHEDIDICVMRDNIVDILKYFSDWDIYAAIPGEHRLERVLSTEDAAAPRYGLHLHKGTDFIEILLTEKIEDKIPFRRDPAISMFYDDFVHRDLIGRRFVAPEMQLLYKAKEGREKDTQDFLNYLPYMNASQRSWLLAGLGKHLPESQWIKFLEQ